jgi:putative FmdB family regulatory protein
MPMFEYTCKSCGKQFESIVWKDEKTSPCPECKSEDVEKNISVASVKENACGAPKKSPFS